MKAQLQTVRDALVDSFLFIPALMGLLAVVLVIISLTLDKHLGTMGSEHFGTIWISGPSDARNVLSVIVTATMTVVSIVFSVTITALAQTSSHYGPRVLRNFTSDRWVQGTFGTFVATFLYSLLVLRAVHVGQHPYVPHLSVNFGVLLAIISLAAVVFFINHIAHLIQAENLIADVGEEFQNTVASLFPKIDGGQQKQETDDSQLPTEEQWQKAQVINAGRSGYLQHVGFQQLMTLATEKRLIIKLNFRPGDFVSTSGPLAQVIAPSGLEDKTKNTFHRAFSLGWHRSPSQDALFTIQQMVEIGVHAMSPAINEPFTTLTCIDWLGEALHEVAIRGLPDQYLYDKDKQLRVVTLPLKFGDVVHVALDEILLYGAQNKDVMLGLLSVIRRIAPDVHRQRDFESLRLQTQLIEADCTQIINLLQRQFVLDSVQETLRLIASEMGG